MSTSLPTNPITGTVSIDRHNGQLDLAQFGEARFIVLSDGEHGIVCLIPVNDGEAYDLHQQAALAEEIVRRLNKR